VTDSQILGIGKANPPIRLTQEESFYATGYQSERIRESFLNSDIEYRHFYFGSTPIPQETSDQQNERYRSGAVHTGCRAIMNCLEAASASVKDVDLLAVCTCTGYVCPDVGSRLIAHMGFRPNVQRATIVGVARLPSLHCSAQPTSSARTRAAKLWS
jgi:predicted naringenin-chalcone synthase